jgi:hypothetical protein
MTVYMRNVKVNKKVPLETPEHHESVTADELLCCYCC